MNSRHTEPFNKLDGHRVTGVDNLPVNFMADTMSYELSLLTMNLYISVVDYISVVTCLPTKKSPNI